MCVQGRILKRGCLWSALLGSAKLLAGGEISTATNAAAAAPAESCEHCVVRAALSQNEVDTKDCFTPREQKTMLLVNHAFARVTSAIFVIFVV